VHRKGGWQRSASNFYIRTELGMINKLSRSIWKSLVVFCVVGYLAGWAQAQLQVTTTETFENGTNEGAWTWGTGSETFVIAGDAHGRYLREDYLVTFTPRASTDFGTASIFTGDYRGRNVASVGIDMALPYVSGTVTGRTVTLILLNDNGTPDDLEDDWGAFTVSDLPIPPTGVVGVTGLSEILQWRSYDIPVPSQSPTLPAGWSWISRNYLRRNGSWARLMRDVDHVGFIMGDPASIYPLLAWDVALDNPRITTIEAQSR
jgi:hypothetical protein